MSQAARYFDSLSIDWNEWIELAEAALLLGLSCGHLRRLCKERLQGRGLALLATPDEGGNERWYLHESYDARLVMGEYVPTGPDGFDAVLAASTRQKNRAFQKRACVMAFERMKHNDPRSVGDWIDDLLDDLSKRYPDVAHVACSNRMTRTTLYRWRRELGDGGGLANLLDTRGGHQDRNPSPEAWEHFELLYCNHPVLQSPRIVGG